MKKVESHDEQAELYYLCHVHLRVNTPKCMIDIWQKKCHMHMKMADGSILDSSDQF